MDCGSAIAPCTAVAMKLSTRGTVASVAISMPCPNVKGADATLPPIQTNKPVSTAPIGIIRTPVAMKP